MKKISRVVLGILMVVLSLSATPKAAFAENKTVTVIKVGNEKAFDDAISTVNSASEGEYVISLTDNVEIGDTPIRSKRPVTLLGNGHTLTVAQYASIHVAERAQVKLGSRDGNVLKICSVSEPSNDEPGLLYIKGTCEMYSGVSLSGREGNNYFGGGVTVFGGTFHMHGGVIENCGIEGGSVCYGGGVAVVYGGKFIMDGGTITNCYVKSDYIDDFDPDKCFTAVGGGVFVSGGSSFVMNGGTISANSATNMGGGIAVVASYEEISRGLGNLKSAVEIKGGTVKSNSAKIGAGVFASAYYYIFAGAICAPTPAIGQSEKPGLYINNAKILNNKAQILGSKVSETDGFGGGVFVAMLKSLAGVHIGNHTVIQGNKAAVGGGVASYGYWTKMDIDGCTITGNEAADYGGGFAAQKNTSGGQTTIKSTVLCNNIAGKAASDVYLDRAPLMLPSAEAMNALYLGKPDDVYNHKIDGWYIDKETSRYTAQTKEQRKTYPGAGDSVIGGTGEVYLIAAAKSALAKITFTDEDGNVIYAESWHPHGTPADQIQVPKAEKASDDTYDYIFEAWSPAIQDVTQDAVYKAIFKRVLKKIPEGNINLPQTGDNSDIALWSALLAVSAAAIVGMAFCGRQKKTR